VHTYILVPYIGKSQQNFGQHGFWFYFEKIKFPVLDPFFGPFLLEGGVGGGLKKFPVSDPFLRYLFPRSLFYFFVLREGWRPDPHLNTSVKELGGFFVV
jgi:hypothetical protein